MTLRPTVGRETSERSTSCDSPGRRPVGPYRPWWISLRTFPEGVRLCTLPAKEVEMLRSGEKFAWQGILKAGENPLATNCRRVVRHRVSHRAGHTKEVGLNVRGTPIRYEVKTKKLTCLGSSAPVELSNGVLKLRILVDRPTIEIFAADGRVNMAYGFLPPEDNKTMAVFAEGGEAKVQSLNVWQLKSTWPRVRKSTISAL